MVERTTTYAGFPAGSSQRRCCCSGESSRREVFRFVRSRVIVSRKRKGFALCCRDLRVCTIGLLAEVLSEGTRYRALVIMLPEVFL